MAHRRGSGKTIAVTTAQADAFRYQHRRDAKAASVLAPPVVQIIGTAPSQLPGLYTRTFGAFANGSHRTGQVPP